MTFSKLRVSSNCSEGPRRWLAAVILSLMFAAEVHAEEKVYYCVSEVAGGILTTPGGSGWTERAFELGRFTFKSNLTEREPKITLSHEIGTLVFHCHRNGGTLAPQALICRQKKNEDSGRTFMLEPESMKFVMFDGSVFSYAAGTDTGVVKGGTCEAF